MTDDELLALCEAQGWDIQRDNEGQIIIYTGIEDNEEGDSR